MGDAVEHYVTLYDGGFLPQGLALHRSLERHAGTYVLWVVCVDAAAYNALRTLALPNLRPIDLAELETDALRAAKKERTRAEYCWTLTPCSIGAVLDRDSSIERVTYIDADVWLLRSPASIFAELDASRKSVLITEHAYAPDFDQTNTSGRYCVQFITFARRGRAVLDWWTERCVEWCFARFEDGRFGDQKYLDDWPERFGAAVHVLQKSESILAPWNAARFPYGSAVAYHFHTLRVLGGGRVQLYRGYDVPAATLTGVYDPYLRELAASVKMLESIGHVVQAQGKAPNLALRIGIFIRKALRLLARLRPVAVARLPR